MAARLGRIAILIVVSCMTAVGIGLIWIAREAQREAALQYQEKCAEQVAWLISSHVRKAVGDLELFLALKPPDEQKSALEKLVIHRSSQFTQIALLGTDGRERMKVSRYHSFLPHELAERSGSPAFRTALAGKIYIGPVRLSPESGLLSSELGVPFANSDDADVLIAELNMRSVWQQVSLIAIKKTGYAYLVDSGGRFVAYQELSTVLQRYGEDMRHMPPVADFLERKPAGLKQGYEYAGLLHDRVIGLYQPIPGTDWAVIVELPVREAFAAVVRMQGYLLLLAVVGAVVAGFLMLEVVRSIVHPIQALTLAAHRMSRGELNARVAAADRGDEVSVLARAFGRMQQELRSLYENLERQIAELKQIQGALRESEELYTRLIATIPDMVVRTDMTGVIHLVNDIARRLGGYLPEEIIGKNIFDFVHPGDRARVMDNMGLMIQRRLGPKEYTLLMKDGSERIFEVNADVLRDRNGEPFGIVNICRDITERKHREVERLRLEERLHRAEKMEALGLLAGGVAHDLNNVLGVLVGYSDLLLLEIPEGNPLRKRVLKIFESGKRAAAIIQDLLTLARRGVAVPEVVNLNRVVRESLDQPEFEALKNRYPGIRFQTELEENLRNIKGSPIHLSKIVMNLVMNAAESIAEAGIVTIRTENRRPGPSTPGLDACREGDYAVLIVRDTGKGMSSKDLGKIFEPFYTTKIMGRSGSGLGLAVVWGSVKDHEGHIDVRSEEGRGSSFTLYFPATREEKVSRTEKSPIERYRGKGESILVVDDAPEQREMAQKLLERLGYRVRLASSGEEAVAFFGSNRFDLLMLDMIMDPGMDGLETYQRALRIVPGQKAVIVSGFTETEKVKRARELGAGAYVRKPYILETLAKAIREELDRGRT